MRPPPRPAPGLVRLAGVEPASRAYRARALPLSNSRMVRPPGVEPGPSGPQPLVQPTTPRPRRCRWSGTRDSNPHPGLGKPRSYPWTSTAWEASCRLFPPRMRPSGRRRVRRGRRELTPPWLSARRVSQAHPGSPCAVGGHEARCRSGGDGGTRTHTRFPASPPSKRGRCQFRSRLRSIFYCAGEFYCAVEGGQGGGTRTRDLAHPKRACWPLHYALTLAPREGVEPSRTG